MTALIEMYTSWSNCFKIRCIKGNINIIKSIRYCKQTFLTFPRQVRKTSCSLSKIIILSPLLLLLSACNICPPSKHPLHYPLTTQVTWKLHNYPALCHREILLLGCQAHSRPFKSLTCVLKADERVGETSHHLMSSHCLCTRYVTL